MRELVWHFVEELGVRLWGLRGREGGAKAVTVQLAKRRAKADVNVLISKLLWRMKVNEQDGWLAMNQ